MSSAESDAAPKLCVEVDHAEALRGEFVQSIAKTALNNFNKIDKDGNGFLKKDELNTEINAAPAGSKDRQQLTVLRDHLDDVAGLSDDETFFEWSGASRKDLNKLATYAVDMPQEMAIARDISERNGAHWAEIVAGSDRIHSNEFDWARANLMRAGKASTCDIQAFSNMEARYDEIHHLHAKVGSIKLEDLQSYPSEVQWAYKLVFDMSDGK